TCPPAPCISAGGGAPPAAPPPSSSRNPPPAAAPRPALPPVRTAGTGATPCGRGCARGRRRSRGSRRPQRHFHPDVSLERSVAKDLPPRTPRLHLRKETWATCGLDTQWAE